MYVAGRWGLEMSGYFAAFTFHLDLLLFSIPSESQLSAKILKHCKDGTDFCAC